MRKYFVLFILVSTFSFTLASCGSKSRDEGKIVITFWHSFVSNTIPALNELIERFEKEHPNIKIKAQYVPSGDPLIQKLVTAIQSHTAPDIAWIHSDYMDKLVEADAIYPMDYFTKGSDGLTRDELNDIFPPLLQSARWRDTLYALPMECTTLALLYNKTLFRQAGLDPNHPPKDWNELREYARKLTLDKNHDGKIDQYGFYVPVFPASGPLSIWMILQWEPYLWQAGGRVINPEQTRVEFNSQAGVKALLLWKELYTGLNLTNYTLTHNMGFASGSLAMIMDGPWDLPEFRKMNNKDWAVASLPAGPVKKATYLAGEHLAIFKQSRHPKEAWTFLKWVISPDVQAMFSEASGYLPVRRSTLELKAYKDFLERDPAMKAFVEQIPLGQARGVIDYHRVEINQIIASAVEDCIIGKTDIKTALDAAAEKSNRLLRAAN
ncbi:MAG: ABC transporter substrate-binding protein [Ignavibacteria bacterium]|jgi:ABC-type glycerol-3-phosphate transport system substrate-binding protein|nr:ABC transporter substrate-binding protein [Ignavibacteria bacterium]MCU7505016.1 ABC transporter substrate-binding protein [Ignavibacteria bacterium]MCU7514850.1 ABC transporter substrate-binding protein [Ignavibacteria bacterium]